MTTTFDAWKKDYAKRIYLHDLPPIEAAKIVEEVLENHGHRVALVLSVAKHALKLYDLGATNDADSIARGLACHDLDFQQYGLTDRANEHLAFQLEYEAAPAWALELARKRGWIPGAPMPDAEEEGPRHVYASGHTCSLPGSCSGHTHADVGPDGSVKTTEEMPF